MGMLEDHRTLRIRSIVTYHRFLIDYRPDARTIYAFFEGQEDQSIYINHLQSNVPEGWNVQSYCCGNKDNVYQVFEKIDWAIHPKNRILFFVDKDLSNIITEDCPNEENIYVTGYYSVENYLVTTTMLERVLREIYHLDQETAITLIIQEFERNLARFYKYIRFVMSWIVCCRRNVIRPHLNGIKVKKLLAFNNDGTLKKVTPEGHKSILGYLEKVCNTKRIENLRIQLKGIQQELETIPNPKVYVRGKYEVAFFVLFINYIWDNLLKMQLGINIKPKIHTSLGLSNVMEILGPRVLPWDDLKSFLSTHFNSLHELAE